MSQLDPTDATLRMAREPRRCQAMFPMERSRLATMIFLSTEAMLFAALIGSYIVLRFSGNGVWPDQSQVHVDPLIGTINTVLLLTSGIAIVLAVRASAANRPAVAKIHLVATIALGTAFLSIKGSEYFNKFEIGILPTLGQRLMYDRADDDYLSHAVKEMRATIRRAASEVAMESNSQRKSSSQQRLEKLYLLQSGVVDWTQYKVGRTGDAQMKRSAIETMAHQIHPIDRSPRFDKYLIDEADDTRLEHQRITIELAEVEGLLKRSQAELKTLLPKRSGGAVDERERFERESVRAARLTDTIAILKNDLVPLQNRIQAVDFVNGALGINRQFDIKLPIVIPGGNRWASLYCLLTGMHALHLLAGLAVLTLLLPMSLHATRVVLLQNISLYWHFVDAAWLIIFAVVYLS